MNNFEWFTGVVEDIHDPEKMNRVRVRMFGIHTEDTTLIPTEDLPWSTVMMPATSSGISGLMESPHGLLQGSWVVGFFRDNAYQDAVVMGSIASKFEEKPSTSGFKDPDGNYPKEKYIGEPDVNKLARGEDTEDEIVKAKKDGVDKSVKTPVGTWDEPPTEFAAEYPYNRVHQTTSGHIFEVDDTEGAERIHEYHRTGTFREVHPDGTIVTKIVADNYTIVAKDDNVHVMGNVNLTIDANCNMYIKKDWNIDVDGNVNINVKKNWTEKIDQNVTSKVGKNVTKNIGGSRKTDIGSTETRNSGGKMSDNAPTIHHN